jgi:hypothetical protein
VAASGRSIAHLDLIEEGRRELRLPASLAR